VYKFGTGSSLPGMKSASGPGWNCTVQFQPSPDAHRRLESLPNLYTVPLEDGLKESPKHVRQK
jgi:hypothetical protein